MLWERYGAEIEAEAGREAGCIHLTTFQRDGVWRAKRSSRTRNGVLIADGVGLGKTFIAGELIQQGRARTTPARAPRRARDAAGRPWRCSSSDGAHIELRLLRGAVARPAAQSRR